MRFAIRAAQSLRDVEDDVRLSRPQPLGEIGVRLEADHLAERAERLLDGVDRLRAVPLGELVVDQLGAAATPARDAP